MYEVKDRKGSSYPHDPRCPSFEGNPGLWRPAEGVVPRSGVGSTLWDRDISFTERVPIGVGSPPVRLFISLGNQEGKGSVSLPAPGDVPGPPTVRPGVDKDVLRGKVLYPPSRHPGHSDILRPDPHHCRHSLPLLGSTQEDPSGPGTTRHLSHTPPPRSLAETRQQYTGPTSSLPSPRTRPLRTDTPESPQ